MNFQSIKPVEEYKFYLDLAFRRAREKGDKLRGKKLKGGRLDKSKYIELMKMQVINDTIVSRMDAIVKSFPQVDDLPEFYNELVKLTIDYGQLKKSLGSVNWLRIRSKKLFDMYKGKINRNKQFERINILKKEFLGRLSSMVKQIKKDFIFLEEARRIFKEFPVVKTSLKTVAVAGFPNVGKTTLLFKLTGSKPEINSYPFTTKGVNVSYIGKGKDRIQLLDTPGTLNRFEKMNNIERIAYLAIKHCAELIVFVFDLTEEYPLEKQVRLYDRLKNDFNKDIIVYVSKSDIIEKADIEKFKKRFKNLFTDTEELKKNVISFFRLSQ
jgi:nucleolar GTP-binding protein